MVKKHPFFCVTTAVFTLFLLCETVSLVLILNGASMNFDKAFGIGIILLCLWVVNPFPATLSIIGLLKCEKHKFIYIAFLVVSLIAWLLGGALLGSYL